MPTGAQGGSSCRDCFRGLSIRATQQEQGIPAWALICGQHAFVIVFYGSEKYTTQQIHRLALKTINTAVLM